MKTILLSLALLLGINAMANDEQTEVRPLDSFNKIIATNGINVLLRQSTEEKVEVRIKNAPLEDVITEVEDGVLKLKMRPQVNKELSVICIVYFKGLDAINITKAATVTTKSIILTDIMDIKANTGGEVKAEIECKKLKLSAIAGSRAYLYGWAKEMEVKANAGSEVKCKTLKADKIIAKSTAGAEVWVSPKELLEANANTGGKIYYVSNPKKLSKKVSSGGEVKAKIERIGHDLIRDEDE